MYSPLNEIDSFMGKITQISQAEECLRPKGKRKGTLIAIIKNTPRISQDDRN